MRHTLWQSLYAASEQHVGRTLLDTDTFRLVNKNSPQTQNTFGFRVRFELQSRVDRGFNVGLSYGLYFRPHMGSMSFWLTRNVDRSSYKELVQHSRAQELNVCLAWGCRHHGSLEQVRRLFAEPSMSDFYIYPLFHGRRPNIRYKDISAPQQPGPRRLDMWVVVKTMVPPFGSPKY